MGYGPASVGAHSDLVGLIRLRLFYRQLVAAHLEVHPAIGGHPIHRDLSVVGIFD